MKEILSTDIGPGCYEYDESLTLKRNTINTPNLKNNISGWKREYEVQRNATIPNLFTRNLKLSKEAQTIKVLKSNIPSFNAMMKPNETVFARLIGFGLSSDSVNSFTYHQCN
ncbi:hypothetical protein Smp_134340 [Schistosoma mansoni]|uniref:hypothetical protein n=1 Tax=Schistosoma mansoni TaxID=6183 RepID=UPI0001A63FFD|nr:hypothetical protein Smp_134340 [Schistosoma mansoni]|eukprot:XP_018654002.1 hypothetical protein Smp_134340 [Schistosoma mansoni]